MNGYDSYYRCFPGKVKRQGRRGDGNGPGRKYAGRSAQDLPASVQSAPVCKEHCFTPRGKAGGHFACTPEKSHKPSSLRNARVLSAMSFEMEPLYRSSLAVRLRCPQNMSFPQRRTSMAGVSQRYLSRIG